MVVGGEDVGVVGGEGMRGSSSTIASSNRVMGDSFESSGLQDCLEMEASSMVSLARFSSEDLSP